MESGKIATYALMNKKGYGKEHAEIEKYKQDRDITNRYISSLIYKKEMKNRILNKRVKSYPVMEADMIFKSKNYDYENNIDRNWQNENNAIVVRHNVELKN